MASISSVECSFEEFSNLSLELKKWCNDSNFVPLFKRVDDGVRAAALNESKLGLCVELGRLIPAEPATDNKYPSLHYMSMLGEKLAEGDEEPGCYKDFLGLDYHGKVVSHIDAFSHISFNGEFFGGLNASSAIDSKGVKEQSCDVTAFGGIVTRGVLLDMTKLTDSRWCEPGQVWTEEDVNKILELENVSLRSGDALLFHGGHDVRRREMGAWDPDQFSAGLDCRAVPSLLKRGVTFFGADGETDVRPSPVDRVTLPIHVLCLVIAGIPLLDNLKLDDLAAECARLNRWTFTLVVAPLRVRGGTGSPVNPLAIF